jgi:hypothetical protein
MKLYTTQYNIFLKFFPKSFLQLHKDLLTDKSVFLQR